MSDFKDCENMSNAELKHQTLIAIFLQEEAKIGLFIAQKNYWQLKGRAIRLPPEYEPTTLMEQSMAVPNEKDWKEEVTN